MTAEYTYFIVLQVLRFHRFFLGPYSDGLNGRLDDMRSEPDDDAQAPMNWRKLNEETERRMRDKFSMNQL